MGINRNKLIEMLDEGLLDPKTLANDLLGYLSEDDCEDFAEKNGIELSPEEEEEDEEFEFTDEDEVNDEFEAYYYGPKDDKPAIREAFSMFVDALQREGKISDDLAFSVTLRNDD